MRYFAFLTVMLLMFTAAPAVAHGLLMKLRTDGDLILGELYYSNGTKAGGEWVELKDLDDSDVEPQVLQTDESGTFRVPGIPDHRYRITAFGEEGHSIAMELTLTSGARGTLIKEDGQEEGAAGTTYPAWAVIGGLLLLSVIPLRYFQRRSRR